MKRFLIIILAVSALCFPQEIPGQDFAVKDYPCNACHIPDDWSVIQPSGFDHDTTNFPLTGTHGLTRCSLCHTGSTLTEKHLFSSVKNNCFECHLDIHETQLGQDCAACHSPLSWESAADVFRHEESLFPLIGSHAGLPCDQCHTNQVRGEFRGISTDCITCHESAKLQGDMQFSGHDQFSLYCQSCHEPFSWKDAQFNHADTGFPLLGNHLQAQCIDCHYDGYSGTQHKCEFCHIDAYNSTTAPSHSSAIYVPTDCAFCHDANGWSPSVYDHYPEPANCNICHLSDLLAANISVPNHQELPITCIICHTTSSWQNLDFDHTITGFAIEGIHQTLDCSACHETGFSNTDNNCMDCHADDYNQTTSPDHISAGFDPDDCHLCHNALGWIPAEFDHSLTNQACSACHSFTDGWDPQPLIDHASAVKLGSAINNCTLCHVSTDNWLNITFENNKHDGSEFSIFFDIYSGEHNNEWNASCTDNCHVFGAFDTFSCYDNCHTNRHSRNGMLDEHCENGSSNCQNCSGFNGYWSVNTVYSDGSWSDPSTFIQCYQCHPDGDKNGPCGDDISIPDPGNFLTKRKLDNTSTRRTK